MSELAKLGALTRWLGYAGRIADDVALWGRNAHQPFTAVTVLKDAEHRIGASLIEMVPRPARKPYAAPTLTKLDEDDPRVVAMKNEPPREEPGT